MTMGRTRIPKYGWATAATDQETAIQAIILGRSLARVMTKADTIIFISEDLDHKIRQVLAECFDAVIQVDQHEKLANKTNLSAMDLMKMFGINMEMYAKIVVMNPNSLVLQNCDELFHLEKKYYTTESRLCVLQPNSVMYSKIKKLASSQQYFSLSDVILASCDLFGKMDVGKLSTVYNSNISDFQVNNNQHFETLKIVFYDSPLNMAIKRDSDASVHGFPNIKKITDFWTSCWEEIQEMILSNSLLSPLEIEDVRPTPMIREYYKDAIAIVGHSCRFPEANNSEEFWDLLINGVDGIRSVPIERAETLQLNEKQYTRMKGGFLKCPIDEFDTKFFGISPREAELIDPQQRLLLEVAWEALENAAINPLLLKGGNTGVFTGVWQTDYEKLVKENTSSKAFHNVVLGNSFSATSARISNILGLNGPNIATESGCSSSLVALHLACESLTRRETDLGLVMGANLVICKDIANEEVPILAKDGHCKTFDEKADGFGRAEGIAAIILKRLPDAIKNGDRVMGIVRGTAMSNEGTASSFGTPSKVCQEIAVRDALCNSRIRPEEVDYVEAHGTGTPVGDPIEFAALSAGYASKREKPLIIGSVKTNTGHCESAAGLAGIIKVLLSMEHEVIPPHRNFDTLNPNINLDALPAILPLERQPWKRNEKRARIAGVSSFGISGTNVHALLEEPPNEYEYDPIIINPLEIERTHHILTLSAKTENALHDLSNRYVKYLKDNTEVDIRDLTFTANNGRAQFKHRLSVTGKDNLQLAEELGKINSYQSGIKDAPKIVFLFTGQGSQYFGMAKTLYQSNCFFRNAFDDCATIVKYKISICLKQVLWGKNQDSHLEQCVSSQLSIFSVEYALLNLLRKLGVNPDVALGHSVGEYAAAVASEIINLEDALTLLINRSQLIATLPPGGMMAITCSKEKGETLISLCGKGNKNFWLDIAVVNSPEEIVVAGKKEYLEIFQQVCMNNKVHCKILAASHAFHSRDIDAILPPFSLITNQVKYNDPVCQYVSGTTGTMIDKTMDGSYWLQHARESVNFQKGIQTLAEHGCNTFIEVGPRPILLALGMGTLTALENTLWLPTLHPNKDNWETLLDSLGKLYKNRVNINWSAIDTPEIRRKLELPTYPFQRQKYWINIPERNESKEIHPLLGKKVSLASVKESVYINQFSLENFPYFKDHQVANLVIMPGAGFLEIILAAGNDLLSKGATLHVQDFCIEVPLELEDGKLYDMQVVATPIENESLKICIYFICKLNGYNNEKGWKRYSSATVSAMENDDIQSEFPTKTEFENVKSRFASEATTNTNAFYKKAYETGINFGDTFRVWEKTFTLQDKEALTSNSLDVFPDNLSEYFYHPIILDSIVQMVGHLPLSKSNNSSPYLPVRIDNCYTFRRPLSNRIFVHSQWDDKKGNGTVAMYNEENDLLVAMTGVVLVKTSVSSFLVSINGQKNKLPKLFQEIWRPRLGPLQSRLDLNGISSLTTIYSAVEKAVEGRWKPFALLNTDRNEYIQLRLFELFEELGLSFEMGKEYTTRSVMQDNLISMAYTKFFDTLIEMLVEDGFIVRMKDSWKLKKLFPTAFEKRKMELHSFIMDCDPVSNGIMVKCLANIKPVFQGMTTAVDALFDHPDMNILDLYRKGKEYGLANARISAFLNTVLQNLRSRNNEVPTVRIIEIGGGSAASSIDILNQLQKNGISVQYTFTDISSQFFANAMNVLSAFDGVEYKVLDIEKDPSIQGFCPHYYDIVIASNVFHATKSLKTSIMNSRKLLVDGGLLIIQEMLRPFRSCDITFGMLDSYWKFNDYDLRTTHPMVCRKTWNLVFSETSFSDSQLLSSEDENLSILVTKALDIKIPRGRGESKLSWLLFCDDGVVHEQVAKKLATIGENVVQLKHSHEVGDSSMNFVNMLDESAFNQDLDKLTKSNVVCGIIYLISLDSGDQDELYRKTLTFCKYIARNAQPNMKILVATRGAVCPASTQKTIIPSGAVIWGMIKSLINEVSKSALRLVDLDPDATDEETEAQEICFELFSGNENLVSYRNKKKLVARFVALRNQTPLLSLPKGGYKLEIPKSKRIDDLCFKPFRNCGLEELDVQVMVKAISLNFRDILVIMKPEGYHTLFDAVGSDFAGIVSAVGSRVTKFKVGDEVFGFGEGTAASHVIQKETGMIFQKPAHFNFCEASTIPSTFLTAYYCLVTIAGLQKNETVLIHVASGGVGLFAIQIAKHIGARIIATAGSHRKRRFLRSLGLKYVFHSRDLTFGEDIYQTTNSQGVDVVLNSLTGPGFKETTLENCSKNARFVEIGKMNIWENEDVRNLRSDVDYTIVDLEKVSSEILVDIMQNVYNKEMITPVAYTRFQITNIRDALNYFMKAQHIGKIVVSMPGLLNTGTELVTKEELFNRNGMYLITGGLGGIGLEVAKWMADSGADCLILIGRSAPNPRAIQAISKLRNKGCRVLTFEVDIGSESQCQDLFQKITSPGMQLPPLKGVIHCAGIISDATFANQTWEKYESVFNAKVHGCLNLHNFTKDMNLECFVLFSSIAANTALVGQSNYSAANAYLDAFAHYRYSMGLPAQTVNWGAWSEIGLAVDSVYGSSEYFGWLKFNPNQGIAALQFLMSRPNLIQLGVTELNANAIQQTTIALGSYFKDLDLENTAESRISSTVQSEIFWTDMEPLTLDDRIIYIKNHLVTIIRKTLKLPNDEQINDNQIFSEMGLDSLMSVELRNKLQSMFGDKLSLNVATLIDHPTISGLSQHLAQSTYLENMEMKTETAKFDEAEYIDLAKKDSILPDDVMTIGNLENTTNEIQNVFLTGVTGHMSGFLLQEILRNPRIRVFCLVRGSSQEHAHNRLVDNLKKFRLLPSIDLDRVSVVVGDIAGTNLGISDKEYQNLSENIDTVIHFAVNGSHVEKYQIDPRAKSDIRSVNVLGTINILRFAANIRTKRVYYSSSISAVNRLDNEGFAYEDFPDDDNNGEKITIGYALTKFVCEKLMKQAISRGIPCIVIRYPVILGNSVTGHFTLDSDFSMNLVLLMIKLGVVIDCEGGWSYLSADNAAELTALLIFDDSLQSGMYNLWQPTVLKMTQLAEIASDLGCPMTRLKEDVFFDSISKNNDNSFMYFFKQTYGPDSLSMLYNKNYIGNRLLNERKCICQISHKIRKSIPDIVNRMVEPYTLVKRCLTYAKSSGIFKEYNIIPSIEQ